MWSRLARIAAVAVFALLPALVPPTSAPALAFGGLGLSPGVLGPAAQGGDACPEPNDTFQDACYLGPSSEPLGYLSNPNDVDAYRIEVLDFNTDVHVEMPQRPGPYKASLANWNGDIIAESNTVDGVEMIDTTVDIPGVYYIFVHSTGGASSASRPYQIFRALTYPGASIPEILYASEFRAGQGSAIEGEGETDVAVHAEDGGRYTISMKVPGTLESPSISWWAPFGPADLPEFTDFTMTMDARVVNKVDAGFFVLFRLNDLDNTYVVFIDAKDGQARMTKAVGGEATHTDWTPSSAIDVDGGVNRVVVHCFEDELRVNVNGEDVFGIRDSSIRKGKVGIGAMSYGPPAIVSFDNIIITTPAEGLP